MTELTTTEGIAHALLPYYTDGSNKARYLTYIMSGFSVTESIELAHVHLKTVYRWRDDDPIFVELEAKAKTTLRKQLSDQLLDIEFTRNFRLVLAKDQVVLYKDATGQDLTTDEVDYIKIIRKFYTPQQFAMLRQMFSGNGEVKQEGFNFVKTVLELRLTKESVHVGENPVPQVFEVNED